MISLDYYNLQLVFITAAALIAVVSIGYQRLAFISIATSVVAMLSIAYYKISVLVID